MIWSRLVVVWGDRYWQPAALCECGCGTASLFLGKQPDLPINNMGSILNLPLATTHLGANLRQPTEGRKFLTFCLGELFGSIVGRCTNPARFSVGWGEWVELVVAVCLAASNLKCNTS